MGLVNRITKRATVLVEDAEGQKYSDGLRYKTYYVPIVPGARAGGVRLSRVKSLSVAVARGMLAAMQRQWLARPSRLASVAGLPHSRSPIHQSAPMSIVYIGKTNVFAVWREQRAAS
jgi:hypothetical protein